MENQNNINRSYSTSDITPNNNSNPVSVPSPSVAPDTNQSASTDVFEPINAAHFSWGAFFHPWVAIVAARRYRYLLMYFLYLVPLAGVLIVHVYFGMKGRVFLQNHNNAFASNSELAGFIRGFDRVGKFTAIIALAVLLLFGSIIGAISSMTFNSLNDVFNDSEISAVKANMNNARSSAELYFSTNESYVGMCDYKSDFGAEPYVGTVFDVSLQLNPEFTCRASNDSYVAYIPVESGVYCVDSMGSAYDTTEDQVGEFSCQ